MRNGRGSVIVDARTGGLIVSQYVTVQRVRVRLNLLYQCTAEQLFCEVG
jgi:hypothetical protein